MPTFNGAFFMRILLAAIAVAFVWLILPPFFDVLHVHPGESLITVIRLCVAALAVFYVLTGSPK